MGDPRRRVTATKFSQDQIRLYWTFTHCLVTIVAILAICYLIAAIAKKPHWNMLGIGLGIGVLMHILLDLLIWFGGVAILWPISSWINL